ncbi:MAG: hypothetical protein HY675_19685 [Chloroflexi bacterium]|nr:hypothetical protein [Chloroflexota bacterium]
MVLARCARLFLPLLLTASLVVALWPGSARADVLGPSVVRVERLSSGEFVYLVNEEVEYMVGMGYNAIYRFLPDEERAARYNQDFSRMVALGINTILGWDADKGFEQDKWDELTLDKAWEHGIGVVMPFYLPPEGNYEDAAFREQLKAELAAKVVRYRDHPALRMWGIGNEVIEGVTASGQVDVFGSLYLELADIAHELDPNHPVIYREAEDVYLPLLSWYRPDDGVERPWLLYGMNFYTYRLEEALANWPLLSNGMPLFVTEFAPEGCAGEDRVVGYLKMWEMIRSHPDFVLGGAPYVWTTDGPEPVDREYGLVDGDGNPVDGSLEAMSGEFLLTSAGGGPSLLQRAKLRTYLSLVFGMEWTSVGARKPRPGAGRVVAAILHRELI